MATRVKEVWTYKRMAASGQLAPRGGKVAGFFCTTAGTLQITEGETSGGDDIVSSFSVAAGTWYPFPFDLPEGAWAVMTGCVGTFGV